MEVLIAINVKTSPNEFVKIYIEGVIYSTLVFELTREIFVILENDVVINTIVNVALVTLQLTSVYVEGILLFF